MAKTNAVPPKGGGKPVDTVVLGDDLTVASIRISGWGGPGDPYVTNYNAAQQTALQEVVDDINSNIPLDDNGDPVTPLHINDTYLEERINEMVESWLFGRVIVKSRQVKLAYEDADDALKAQVTALLGL